MSQQTVNGKPLSQVLSDFKKPFEKSDFRTDMGGHSYLPKPTIKARFDDTVSLFHYDFLSDKPMFQEIAGKMHVIVNCTLILYDDNGNKILSRSHNGDAPIIVSNSTGGAVNVSNDIESAVADAFKRICKWLGIGENQMNDISEKNKSKGKNKSNSNDGSSTESESIIYTVTLKGSFSSIGKNGLSVKCIIKGEKDECELVLWKDAQDLILERTGYENITAYTNIATSGVKLTFSGYEKQFNGKRQVIMTGFAD